MAPPNPDAQAAALARARQHGIRVARLAEDTWRVESSAPLLRGPYLVICLEDTAACECEGGRFVAVCHHRAAVLAAIDGDYPICDLAAIRGPATEAPPRRETREERRQRMIAEYDTACTARRATATVTADDYALFDYGG